MQPVPLTPLEPSPERGIPCTEVRLPPSAQPRSHGEKKLCPEKGETAENLYLVNAPSRSRTIAKGDRRVTIFRAGPPTTQSG